MADFEMKDGTTRDDLMQRVALMEAMIAEGRSMTMRCGWIFVLWGLVDLAGVALELLHPDYLWNWPAVIAMGILIQFAGLRMRRNSGRVCAANTQSRAISAIWAMMGVSLTLYCFTAIFTHRSGGVTYLAAIFIIIGFAHAASAIILRWRVQGAVAILWWAGGLASFFLSSIRFLGVFCFEMLFGMILFGIYAMILERRSTPPSVTANA
jgi:hypothetical protein